jgi:hypothetical protein
MHSRFPVLPICSVITLVFLKNLSAQAPPQKKPAHWNWVESEEAQYCSELGIPFGVEVESAISGELLAKADPKLVVTKVETKRAWRDFLDEFALFDEKSGEPRFDAALGYEKKFEPDFKKEIVLVLSTKPAMREGIGGFMDIEVWEHKNELKVFSFFGGAGPAKIRGGGKPKRLHLVTIPRRLVGKPACFRLAYQSWGRPCSRFSPVVGHLGKENVPRGAR